MFKPALIASFVVTAQAAPPEIANPLGVLVQFGTAAGALAMALIIFWREEKREEKREQRWSDHAKEQREFIREIKDEFLGQIEENRKSSHESQREYQGQIARIADKQTTALTKVTDILNTAVAKVNAIDERVTRYLSARQPPEPSPKRLTDDRADHTS